jgi:cobalt/nickel transport system permease protein
MLFSNLAEIGRMDEIARQDTPVHRVDARAKVLVTLAYLVAVMSFPRDEISSLTPFLLYPVALASIGRIPAWHILKKIAIAAPFAVAVGIFNPLLDREPALAIGSFAVTGGWVSFGSIMFRFVLTVGAVLVVVSCTGMNRIGAAMDQLGVPRVFVVQLMFLYRYLFVISDQALKMVRSAELRSGGHSPGIRVYGSMTGHLLLRAMDRAERVYRAMVARGFDGEVRVMNRTRFRIADAVFVFAWLAFFACARLWDLAAYFGLLIAGGVL